MEFVFNLPTPRVKIVMKRGDHQFSSVATAVNLEFPQLGFAICSDLFASSRRIVAGKRGEETASVELSGWVHSSRIHILKCRSAFSGVPFTTRSSKRTGINVSGKCYQRQYLRIDQWKSIQSFDCFVTSSSSIYR